MDSPVGMGDEDRHLFRDVGGAAICSDRGRVAVTSSAELARIEEALRRGVRLVFDPPRPRFRGPVEALALVKETPKTARELLHRASAFRRQADEWSRTGRPGVPLLVLSGAPGSRAGACVSCGAPIPEGWRCRICRLAFDLALGLRSVGGVA